MLICIIDIISLLFLLFLLFFLFLFFSFYVRNIRCEVFPSSHEYIYGFAVFQKMLFLEEFAPVCLVVIEIFQIITC